MREMNEQVSEKRQLSSVVKTSPTDQVPAQLETSKISEVDPVSPESPACVSDGLQQNVDPTELLMRDYFPNQKESDPHVVEKLTYGVLSEYLPNLQKSKSTLSEVLENQRILIETIQQENAKFGECTTLDDVTTMMDKAKLYHTKLLSIRKDMVAIHEKSANLKRRALRLQQQKQKEALQREQDREKELERERQLIAKTAKKSR